MEDGLPADPTLEELMAVLADSIDEDPAFDPEAFFAEYPAHASVLRAGLRGLRTAGLLHGSEPASLAALSSSTAERYRFEGVIGRGGMGVVHRAFDADLGRVVALKTVRPDLSPTERAAAGDLLIARFLNEARVTGGLEHPGIVPVHDLGILHGQPFFTMKLVGGRSLGALIESRHTVRSIEFTEAVTVLERVCEALAYAHSSGVVHRDLKPANVMVGDFGEVYVMDWGLAKRHGDTALAGSGRLEAHSERQRVEGALSLHGDTIGTLEYMAPEQAGGDLASIDARTDVFGVGAILFHLLVGIAPYACNDREAALRAAQRAEPVRPISNAGLPTELVAVCRKAMAKDPADRYESAPALAEDLRAFRLGLPGRAWSDPPARRFAKAVRRHPTAAAAVLAVSVIVSLATAGGWWLHVVEVQRQALARREREASLSAELRRLSETEGTPLDMPEQMRRYGESASALLDLLAEWGVALDGDAPAALLADRIRSQNDRAREDLTDGLFLLAQHLGLSRLAGSGAGPDVQRVSAERRHVRAWPRLLEVVEALVPASAGARALEVYDGWLVDPEKRVALDAEPTHRASPGEVYFWAWVIERLQGPSRAAAVLDRLLERRPDLVWCHLRRGILALCAEDWETAIAHGTAGLALWPASGTARNIIGLALEGKGDDLAADAQYRAAIDGYPQDLANLFHLGCLARQHGGSGDLRDSIELLARAHCVAPDVIGDQGDFVEALTGHAGDTGHEAGSAHALELLLRAARLAPHSWLSHYLYGCALHLGGIGGAAREDGARAPSAR